MFKSKKAFIHHPATWIIVAFIAGFVVAYLMAKGIIPINLGMCPVK